MIQIDIPMPEHCAGCPCYGLNEFERSQCNITGHEFPDNIFDGRPEWCPMKEQEAVKPIKDGVGLIHCGSCNAMLEHHPFYCWNCGQKVKWE